MKRKNNFENNNDEFYFEDEDDKKPLDYEFFSSEESGFDSLIAANFFKSDYEYQNWWIVDEIVSKDTKDIVQKYYPKGWFDDYAKSIEKNNLSSIEHTEYKKNENKLDKDLKDIKDNHINSELSNLFSLSKYSFWIPLIQRQYVWDEKQYKKIIDDLFDLKKSKFLFLNNLVFKKNYYNNHDDETVWEILDGQQRITTLILILAAIGDILIKEKWRKKKQG